MNIGSSALDWPGTIQKHADTSTTLKNRLIVRYKKGVKTGVFASN